MIAPANGASPDGAEARRLAHGAIAVGVAVRILYGLVLHPPLDHLVGDAPGYVQRAAHLAGGKPIPRLDLFMPIGTQLLLSLPMRLLGTGRAGLWGASFLWCALACLFPWFAWKWAAHVLSPRAAALTAVGCALSPLTIIYGGYFGSELPALVLLAAALWGLAAACRHERRVILASGTALVAVVLLAVRQQFALNLLVAAAPLVPTLIKRAGRHLLSGLVGGAAVGLLLVVLLGAPPWRVAGGFPPLAGENGGFNFYYGHCDARRVRTSDLVFESPVRAQRGTGTDVTLPSRRAGAQGDFYRMGWHCITSRPARAAVLVARNMADLTATSVPFPPWTDERAVVVVAEAANAAFCALLGVLVVVGISSARRDRAARVLLLHLASAFVVAAVFLGEPRYRVPYDLFGWALLGWFLDRQRPGRASELASDD